MNYRTEKNSDYNGSAQAMGFTELKQYSSLEAALTRHKLNLDVIIG
jgi:hypothetical protein